MGHICSVVTRSLPSCILLQPCNQKVISTSMGNTQSYLKDQHLAVETAGFQTEPDKPQFWGKRSGVEGGSIYPTDSIWRGARP